MSQHQPRVALVSIPEDSSDSSLQPGVHEPGHREETHETTSSVHCHSVQGIIKLECEHEVVDADEAQTTQSSDYESCPGFIEIAASTESHHPRQSTIECHEEAPGLGEEELVDEEDGDTASGGSQDGVDNGQGDHITITNLGDAALTASVESEEPEDEDEATETSERDRVTLDLLQLALVTEPLQPGSNQPAANQRTDRPQQMNHARPSEVKIESSLIQPASLVPGPVRDWRIDEAGDDDGVHEVGGELASLSHSARHYCGGSRGKHKLKLCKQLITKNIFNIILIFM